MCVGCCLRDAGDQKRAANLRSSSPGSAFLIYFKDADLKNARSETLLQNSIPLLFLPLSLFSAKHVNEVIVGTEQLMEI